MASVLDQLVTVVFGPSTADSTPPDAGQPAAPAARPLEDQSLIDAIAKQRLAILGRDSALSVPAVRKALHVVSGTISTFALQLWRGGQVIPGPAWLLQPEVGWTLPGTLARTVSDLIWHDMAFWRVTDWYVDTARPRSEWFPARFAHISADRVLPIHDPDDVDAFPRFSVDGNPPERLVVFDGHGLGGLRLHGSAMLTLYQQLMEAAGRYAESPLPSVALKNNGADLDPAEIDELLVSWDTARIKRSTAYLNSVLSAETFGWSAKDLQLSEAREHAATEVARLFGLPAFALDAPESDSMTYGNVTDKRRDVAEALRPWLSVIEAALSTPAVTPRGQQVLFAVDAYTRDDPQTRMNTWAVGVGSGVITVDEARQAEPYATGPTPPPTPPTPALGATQ